MKLRLIRLFLATAVLLWFVFVYLYAPAALTPSLASQLSPSWHRGGFGLLVVLAIVAVAMTLGRWYCSILCPAGTVQEVFHRLGRRLGLSRIRFRTGHLRTPVVLVISILGLLGWYSLATLADPIGLLGRSMSAIVGYAGYGRESFEANPMWIVIAAGLVLLVLLPLFLGRWFCDAICPVGYLLGIASRLSPYRISLTGDACVSCGRCEKICPTACIDSRSKRIDSDRCILCLDCTTVCHPGALRHHPDKRRDSGQRRTALTAGVSAVAAGVFLISRKGIGLESSTAMVDDTVPVVPPGSENEQRHQRLCLTCQACVPACPVGIITPSASGRPVLDYDRGYCQFGCKRCNSSCPAGVFKPLPLEEKQRTRIGDTRFHLDRCVVIRRGTSCGACAEVCPTHAVRMVPQGEGLPTIPDFDRDYCIGCGACYHVCPAEPRAFLVYGIGTEEKSLGIRPGGHGDDIALPAEDDTDDDALTDFPF